MQFVSDNFKCPYPELLPTEILKQLKRRAFLFGVK